MGKRKVANAAPEILAESAKKAKNVAAEVRSYWLLKSEPDLRMEKGHKVSLSFEELKVHENCSPKCSAVVPTSTSRCVHISPVLCTQTRFTYVRFKARSGPRLTQLFAS